MKKILIALILVCCAVAATGCTAPVGNSASYPSVKGDGYSSAPGMQGLAPSEKIAESYRGPAPVPTSATGADSIGMTETKIIRTAQVSLEVKDVVDSVDALKVLAAGKGGYISSSNLQKGSAGRLSANIVLRIPQAQFEQVLESIKAAGTVKSVSTQGEDVTEQYVDLKAQKTSYQNQLSQYQEIMKRADKVEDVIKVQAQIDRVQTELNRLEGRIRYLDSRIELSTITVSLQEPEPVGGSSGHDFISVINEGINGFFGMIDAIIILFFMLLPLLLIGGAGYGIYRWKKSRAAVIPSSAHESNGKK